MNGADRASQSTSAGATHGLNEASISEALRGKIEERAGDGGSLAVLLIDCGIVSRIDAIWGYHVGDAVRQRVTALLRGEVLRQDDFVAGMGRDDFVCVLSTVADPAVALLAARKALRVLSAPFWIGDEEVFASPTIGISAYPIHGDQPEVLLQKAKSACNLARELPDRIATDGDEPANSAATRLLYESRLRNAVLEDALDLIFQPQFDLRLGQVMGAEALLCWNDSDSEAIDAKDVFIAAESAEKVSDLVSSVLNRALRIVSDFRYSAGLDLRIGIKLSARALRDADLVEVVRRALGTWSRRPGTLIFEIGDTNFLATDDLAKEALVRLKEVGVKLSIDDPDLELSSLFWLAEMPFQEIKIDVSAAGDFAGMAKSERIIQSLIGLAHQLRLDVVAVGVADDAAAGRLKVLGCDFMQADFKGPALDPKQFIENYGFNEG